MKPERMIVAWAAAVLAVLVSVSTARADEPGLELCGGMVPFEEATNALEKRSARSFSQVNLLALHKDPVFEGLSDAAEAAYDLRPTAAAEYVRSLVYYWRSRVDDHHCKPEVFQLSLEHLLQAYRSEPKNETLVRALTQAVFVKGEDVVTTGTPGFLVPRIREVLVESEEPCRAGTALLKNGAPETVVEPLSELCDEDLELLTELADRARHLPVLRAAVLEHAWGACHDGDDCAAILDDVVAALFECGLTDRILRRYGSRLETNPADWSHHYTAALALSGHLSEAAEHFERRPLRPDARLSMKEARSPLRSLETPLRELITTGSMSTGTVIEAYLSEGGSKVPLLKLLAMSPLSGLQSTRAFAVARLNDVLDRSVQEAEATVSQHRIFEGFTGVLYETKAELWALHARASELARDLPGSLQFRSAHTGIEHIGGSECQGERPELGKDLCTVQGLNEGKSWRAVGSAPDLWLVAGSGSDVRRGLLGVPDRLPFNRTPDGEVSPSSGLAAPLSSACVQVESGRILVDYAQHRITYSLNDVLNDADGDGLSDSAEWYVGSDTHSADTDDDGADDATDPVPSFKLAEDRDPEWSRAVSALWLAVLPTPDRSETRACDPFRGTLFIESADRQMAALATATGFRIIPLFPWEARDAVVPRYALPHIRVRMFGVDVDEGWAFADITIGTNPRQLVLKKQDAEWVLVVDEQWF